MIIGSALRFAMPIVILYEQKDYHQYKACPSDEYV